MLAARGLLGRGRRRAAVPSAGLLVRPGARGARRRVARLPARGDRPRHGAAGASSRPDDGLALVGPLGIGFRPPPDGFRPMLVGGGIGAAPLLCLQEELDEPTVLLGFRSAAHAAGRGAVRRASRACHRRRLGRAPGARHRPAARAELDADPGGDRLRLRAAADARGRARALRRARRARPARARVRAWRAASAPASAAWCPRATATCASAWTGPCSTPTSSRPRCSRGPGHCMTASSSAAWRSRARS